MRRSFVAIMIGFVLLVGACSGNGDVEALPEADDTSTSSSSTTSSTTTTTEPPDDDPVADAEEAVLETWTTLLTAAASGAPDEEQVAIIESLAGADTAEQLLVPLFPESQDREIEFFPALTAGDDGTYAIDDCLVMNRGISTGVSNWFVGAAEPSEESPTGWMITDISVINLDPCVPRSIAAAAIEGYEAFWDAFDQIYDPSNEDSSELMEQTTTDPYRDFARELISQLVADGHVIRGRPQTSPEFFELSSLTDLVIVDCQRTDPNLGVYVEATGERTDLIPPIRQGQSDVIEATMRLEGGKWKIAELGTVADQGCRDSASLPALQLAGS